MLSVQILARWTLPILALTGCTYGATANPPNLERQPLASQRPKTVSFAVLQARMKEGKKIFAELVSGRIRPKSNGIAGRVTNHHTVIGPDGSEIPLPPDFPSKLISNMSCSWVGTTPPNCDNNGAFRRVYSLPYGGAGSANIVGSNSTLTMPPNSGLKSGADTGYIYFEGWPGPRTTNSEAGLVFYPACAIAVCLPYAVYPHYVAYLAIPKKGGTEYYFGTNYYSPGDYMALYISPVTGTCIYSGKDCIAVTVQDLTCGSANDPACIDKFVKVDSGWYNRCCILARMTTIAQNGGNDFTNNEAFGPADWSNAYMNGGTANPAGTQCWPNDSTKVIVQWYGEIQENDFIYLHSGSGGGPCPN